MEISGWTEFFEEIIRLVESSERQFGAASSGYCDYTIERLELCITACSSIIDCMERSSQSDLEHCTLLLSRLLQCLYSMVNKWEDYNSATQHLLPLSPSNDQMFERGRPSFKVSRDILVYLVSLSFKWTEVAAILGISRMTLYR